MTALHAGELPCSGREHKILSLAASLAGHAPVIVSDTITSLDDRNIQSDPPDREVRRGGIKLRRSGCHLPVIFRGRAAVRGFEGAASVPGRG